MVASSRPLTVVQQITSQDAYHCEKLTPEPLGGVVSAELYICLLADIPLFAVKSVSLISSYTSNKLFVYITSEENVVIRVIQIV